MQWKPIYHPPESQEPAPVSGTSTQHPAKSSHYLPPSGSLEAGGKGVESKRDSVEPTLTTHRSPYKESGDWVRIHSPLKCLASCELWHELQGGHSETTAKSSGDITWAAQIPTGCRVNRQPCVLPEALYRSSREGLPLARHTSLSGKRRKRQWEIRTRVKLSHTIRAK